MLDTPIQQVSAALTVMVALAVFRWAGRPERLVALASIAAYVATPLVQNWSDFVRPQWGIATVDGLLLAFLTVCVLRYDRRWLVAVWGFSALAFLAHFGKLLDPTLLPRGYIGGLYILYFGFLAAQVYGVCEARAIESAKTSVT